MEINGNEVRITCGDLGEDYQGVEHFLRICGGKWNTRKKCHVFERGTEVLQNSIETGELPPIINPIAYFPTPVELARECLEMAGFCGGWGNVLEPSAGQGNFANLMRDEYEYDNSTMTLVEYDPFNCEKLQEQGYEPIQADFLSWKPDTQFDSVVMNPPFSLPGQAKGVAWLHHFMHAYKMWNGNGCFLAIIPPTLILNHCFGLPRKNCPGTDTRLHNIEREFQEIVEQQAHVHLLENGAFRESGTNVKTCLVMIPGG